MIGKVLQHPLMLVLYGVAITALSYYAFQTGHVHLMMLYFAVFAGVLVELFANTDLVGVGVMLTMMLVTGFGTYYGLKYMPVMVAVVKSLFKRKEVTMGNKKAQAAAAAAAAVETEQEEGVEVVQTMMFDFEPADKATLEGHLNDAFDLVWMHSGLRKADLNELIGQINMATGLDISVWNDADEEEADESEESKVAHTEAAPDTNKEVPEKKGLLARITGGITPPSADQANAEAAEQIKAAADAAAAEEAEVIEFDPKALRKRGAQAAA